MEISQIYSELLLRIQSLETLYRQVDSHVLQTFNFLWAVIIGVFAIIGVALYFIAQQTAEKGLKKQSQDLQSKIDSYEKRTAALEGELREIKKKLDDLDDCSKVECGSYFGAGAFGEENKNQLHFSFTPHLLLFFSTKSAKVGPVLFRHTPFYGAQGDTKIFSFWGEDKVEWYSTVDSSTQLNEAREVYNYIAIG